MFSKPILVALGCNALLLTLCYASTEATVDKGKALVSSIKANCIACHQIQGGISAGDIGPPLIAIKARFPDRDTLRKQIWDATVINPASRMPPFGRYRILNNNEIESIINYLYTL